MVRRAIVAGQFYSENKTVLEREVKKFIKKKPDNKVKATIVPHAGYMFSGKCAGKVYSVLPSTETYVLIGVNHNNLGDDIAISLENFETPLGEVKNDAELGKEVLKILDLKKDEGAHEFEHSLEVQLPFLQVTQKNFRILPIILKNYNLEICKKLAEAIYEASTMLKRNIICLASSDFTHSGVNYGFSSDMKIDKEAINKILDFDSRGFLETAGRTTICGAGAIAVVIELAKLLGAKKAKLLCYYDSSEIMASDSKVGYASIAFY